MSDGLRNFVTQYNFAINDPDVIRRYRMYEDGRHDEATRLYVAERNAKRDAHIEDARGFKQLGVNPADISKVTGLSLDEIAKL